MIDERHEELATLYALDLLDGAERSQFEATLDQDRELQALTRSLCDTSAALVHIAPAAPPPAALKTRLLASIDHRVAPEPAPARILRPSRSLFRQIVPWAAAACFALGAAWLGQRASSSRIEASALRTENAISEIALKSAQQQLEAERIISRRQLKDAAQQLETSTTELANSRLQLDERDRLLAAAGVQLADRERQLADARSQILDRERQVASLTNRMDTLVRASAGLGRQLGEAKQQIAQLTSDLRTQGDLASFKITTLASMLKNSPQALAVAVWDPSRQEGVLKVEKLPALLPGQDYQLWVVDPQYPNPVDGGVFTVEPATGAARMQFKARQPVSVVNAFAVTLERKGGVPKAEGPFVLLGK